MLDEEQKGTFYGLHAHSRLTVDLNRQPRQQQCKGSRQTRHLSRKEGAKVPKTLPGQPEQS